MAVSFEKIMGSGLTKDELAKKAKSTNTDNNADEQSIITKLYSYINSNPDAFSKIDTNHDNVIDSNELQALTSKDGNPFDLSDQDFNSFMQSSMNVNINNNGTAQQTNADGQQANNTTGNNAATGSNANNTTQGSTNNTNTSNAANSTNADSTTTSSTTTNNCADTTNCSTPSNQETPESLRKEATDLEKQLTSTKNELAPINSHIAKKGEVSNKLTQDQQEKTRLENIRDNEIPKQESAKEAAEQAQSNLNAASEQDSAASQALLDEAGQLENQNTALESENSTLDQSAQGYDKQAADFESVAKYYDAQEKAYKADQNKGWFSKAVDWVKGVFGCKKDYSCPEAYKTLSADQQKIVNQPAIRAQGVSSSQSMRNGATTLRQKAQECRDKIAKNNETIEKNKTDIANKKSEAANKDSASKQESSQATAKGKEADGAQTQIDSYNQEIAKLSDVNKSIEDDQKELKSIEDDEKKKTELEKKIGELSAKIRTAKDKATQLEKEQATEKLEKDAKDPEQGFTYTTDVNHAKDPVDFAKKAIGDTNFKSLTSKFKSVDLDKNPELSAQEFAAILKYADNLDGKIDGKVTKENLDKAVQNLTSGNANEIASVTQLYNNIVNSEKDEQSSADLEKNVTDPTEGFTYTTNVNDHESIIDFSNKALSDTKFGTLIGKSYSIDLDKNPDMSSQEFAAILEYADNLDGKLDGKVTKENMDKAFQNLANGNADGMSNLTKLYDGLKA